MKLSDFIDTIERYVYDGLNTVAEFADAHNMAEELEDEVERLKEENAKLRELAIRMRPICIHGTRCTFADKIYISKAMEELGIEVEDV